MFCPQKKFCPPLELNLRTAMNQKYVTSFVDDPFVGIDYILSSFHNSSTSYSDRGRFDHRFSFQVSISKTGEIFFVYKKIPIPINATTVPFPSAIKIGISDSTSEDQVCVVGGGRLWNDFKVFSKMILLKWLLLPILFSWASAEFFPGEGKNFPGGWQEPTFCQKNNKKDTIFPKKV